MKYRITVEWPEKPFEVTRPQEPTVGAPVFTTEGEDWRLNASMSYVSQEWKWDWYADGYKKAGDLLVAFVSETGMDQDILVFPVVYTYRHYLELRIKELLIMSSYLLDQEFQVPTHHDLAGLWSAALPKLAAIDGSINWDGVTYVIGEFNKIDIRSFAFRYPVAKDGATPSLSGLNGINLGVVRDRIAEVAWMLDGISMGITESLGQKRDCEADIRSEMAQYYADAYDESGY